MQTCPECEGSGELLCTACGGSGYDEDDDPCADCEGNGSIECDTCEGTGEIADDADDED